ETDRGSAAVPKWELPRRQCHAIRFGNHALLEPGDDASVSPDAARLHSGVGGDGAIGRRPAAALSDAYCRHARLQRSGSLYHCLRLADPVPRYVLLDAADQSRLELWIGEPAAHDTGLRTRLPVCAD